MEIVLASASIRREELLKRIITNFEIIISDFDEAIINYSGKVEEYVETLALCKAMDVLQKIKLPSIIIGCDTVVFNEGKVLSKPKDKDEAFNMLKQLSNSTHFVYSGVAIVNSETREKKVFNVVTKVKFSKLTNEQINSYIQTNEPMDKAGAYGIQGLGSVFVEKIEGCFYNVVGLPINKLYKELLLMGVKI